MKRITDKALFEVGRKVFEGRRLDFTDGMTCLQTRDLLGLGLLADAARRRRYGDGASYVVNHHLNYSNICVNGCKFCAFYRPVGASDGYLMSPEQAAAKVAGSRMNGLQEIHLVGSVNPNTDFSYYVDLLQALQGVSDGLRLKAFTAVEIHHISRLAGMDWAQCLAELQKVGLKALTGGGAEVFSERIRQELFPSKIDADTWLAIHGTAHTLGIGTNATLLFGHIETLDERIQHLLRLREQQDRTGGFRAFIPLVFHAANTTLAHLPEPTGTDILKTIATARLMLDNIPHIKAYWIMLGLKLTQVALHFGADDLEGTIVQENITHEAGADTAVGLSPSDLEDLIRDAGFRPVERDTFHQAVGA